MYKLKVVDVILQRFHEPRKRIQMVAGPRQVGKTTSVEQALSEYRGGYTYKLAEGLGLSPIDWLIAEWNAARVKAKSEGGHLLVIDEIHHISYRFAVTLTERNHFLGLWCNETFMQRQRFPQGPCWHVRC